MESENPEIGKAEKGIAMADEIREDDSTVPSAQVHEHQRCVTLAEALARLPGPQGERFAAVFEQGSLLG